MKIKKFIDREILDSRGNPTVEVDVIFVNINQIDALPETLEPVALARQRGEAFVISHRSEETGDAVSADLAVVRYAEQSRTGSVCRGERARRYN
jgi:enolase